MSNIKVYDCHIEATGSYNRVYKGNGDSYGNLYDYLSLIDNNTGQSTHLVKVSSCTDQNDIQIRPGFRGKLHIAHYKDGLKFAKIIAVETDEGRKILDVDAMNAYRRMNRISYFGYTFAFWFWTIIVLPIGLVIFLPKSLFFKRMTKPLAGIDFKQYAKDHGFI